MVKTELEIKREQLIPSQTALNRISDLHKAMTESLKYTRKVISFMVFDQEANYGDVSSYAADASIAQIKRS